MSITPSGDERLLFASLTIPRGATPTILSCETTILSQVSSDGGLFPLRILPPNLSIISDPSVSGNEVISDYLGNYLFIEPGIWRGGDSVYFQHEWYRCDAPVIGASDSLSDGCQVIDGADWGNYYPTEEDVGKYFLAKVRLTQPQTSQSVTRYTASTGPICNQFTDFGCDYEYPEDLASGERALLAPSSSEVEPGDTLEIRGVLGITSDWESEFGEGVDFAIGLVCVNPQNPQTKIDIFTSSSFTRELVLIRGSSVALNSSISVNDDGSTYTGTIQVPAGTNATILRCTSTQYIIFPDEEDPMPVGEAVFPLFFR